MKVICLVPSITETLIEAGVDVVGRTRFCIHPADKIKSIAVVGGTKDIDWSKAKNLGADFLIMDKEENPKSIADESPIPVIALHIQDIATCAENLAELAVRLRCAPLDDYARRFLKLKPAPVPLDHFVDWISDQPRAVEKIEYMIWKNPLMAVGRNTFIGSVMNYLGHELPLYETKYPKLLDTLDVNTTYLFSSEPYPFFKSRVWIKNSGAAAALVDGESFSWFGIRSLRFLEKMLAR